MKASEDDHEKEEKRCSLKCFWNADVCCSSVEFQVSGGQRAELIVGIYIGRNWSGQ